MADTHTKVRCILFWTFVYLTEYFILNSKNQKKYITVPHLNKKQCGILASKVSCGICHMAFSKNMTQNKRDLDVSWATHLNLPERVTDKPLRLPPVIEHKSNRVFTQSDCSKAWHQVSWLPSFFKSQKQEFWLKRVTYTTTLTTIFTWSSFPSLIQIETRFP